jgi:hypothetical protein
LSKLVLVTIHGINTLSQDYAEPLYANLKRAGEDFDTVTINWSDGILDAMRDQAPLFQKPQAGCSIIKRVLAPLIPILRRSLFWVRYYENFPRRQMIRERIRHAIDQARVAHPGHSVIFAFVAHSQGTVILLDTLVWMLDNGYIKNREIYVIVTMGGALGMSALASDLAVQINKVMPMAGWVNIYDPFDVIASPMAYIDARIDDRPINLLGLFTSHIRYWQSRKVAKIIAGVI